MSDTANPDNTTSPSTRGITLNTGRQALDQLVELLSAMRFSISLLMVVAAASVVGTVVEQNKPWVNYVNQFGVFWAEVLQSAGVFSVYNAPWFLAIMGFLVLSLTLCMVRNTAPMLREMHSFKDRMGRAGVLAHKHRGASKQSADLATTQSAVEAQLAQAGYHYSTKTRSTSALIPHNDGNADNAATVATAATNGETQTPVMIAAKKGTSNRWGYILAHGGMVVILVGGLLDSELPLRITGLLRGSAPVVGNQLIAKVPESGRLPAGNLSYRGNVLIPEGSSTTHSVVAYKDGVLVQPMPFELTLKKFNIEYYSTGMPKLFTSDVIVRDSESGETFERKIIVNEPLTYKGVTVYQSSFDDGGSTLQLKGYPLSGARSYDFALNGTVGETTPVDSAVLGKYNVEFSAYRPINVEDLSKTADAAITADKPAKSNMDIVLGAPAPSNKTLRNVGPSVQYKLRDAAGQAREYHAYQVPVQLDGQSVLLLGMRENAGDAFKFLRLPADSDGTVNEYMRLRAALANPALQALAANAFAARSLPAGSTPTARSQLKTSAEKALAVFGGATDKPSINATNPANTPLGGFTAIADLIEKNVPKDQAEQAANVILKVLTGAAWDVWQQARVQDGLKPMPNDEANNAFLQTALTAYSDSFFLDAPFLLQLQDAQHKQASVFQVTRSPGKYVVYAGSLLLVLGVFAMFYIRERRLWVWLQPAEKDTSSTQQTAYTDVAWALSAPKRGIDFDKEYLHWQGILGTKSTATSSPLIST